MFRTIEMSKIELPPVFEGSDRHYWDCVQLCLSVPYFHVQCRAKNCEESEDTGGTFIYSNLNQLIEALNDPTLQISSVLLLSPGRINGTDCWKLEALDSVLAGIECKKAHQQIAYVFALKSGDRYLDALFATKESELRSIKLLAEA